jgi:DeoR/GlpR family transcriptional regulator of sugar metabolism
MRSSISVIGISVIVVGGILRPVSGSFMGPKAESVLRGLGADRLFLRSTVLTWKLGLPLQTFCEAELDNLMMQVSKEINVVADFSKLGRGSISRIGSLDCVHRHITDARAVDDFQRGPAPGMSELLLLRS